MSLKLKRLDENKLISNVRNEAYMINYVDDISVLTKTVVDDIQGGETAVWSNMYQATFDDDLSVGILTVGTTITGSVNGYTAIITSIDYVTETIEYAVLSNPADFESAEELADAAVPTPNSITLDTILGNIKSVFRGRLAKMTGNEQVLSSRLAEKSTHVLYIPSKPITPRNRVVIDGLTYNVLSVYSERDLFETIKHVEVQLELVE